MAIDPKIRFATIFDMKGQVLFSAHRDGVANLLSPEESQKSDVEADHGPIIYRALRLKQDVLHSPEGMP